MPIQRKYFVVSPDISERSPNPNAIQPDSQSDTFPTTGTHGGKKRRMRSRFQNGRITRADDWMVVRFRLDTPDGDRKLVAEKV